MNLTKVLCIAIFWLIGTQVPVMAQYDKYLEKAEEYYKAGDYAPAASRIDKMKKKVIKKLGDKNPYLAVMLIREAKIKWAQGILTEVVPLVEQSVQMSNELTRGASTEHAFILKEAAEVLIQYGHMVKAETYLDEAETVLKNNDAYIEDLAASMEVSRAKIAVGKGYYTEAVKQIDARLDYFKKRAELDEGKRDLREERMEEYADLLILKAHATALKGDLREADRLFEQVNAPWIKKNLDDSHVLYGYNFYLLANILEKQGIVADVLAERYEYAWTEAQRKYNNQHWMVLKMEQELLAALFRANKRGKFNNLEGIHKKTLKEFGKKSIHSLSRDIISLRYDIIDQSFKGVEQRLNKILTDPVLPANHLLRVEVLNMAKNVALLTQQRDNVLGYFSAILKINKETLGEDAPEYHLSLLRQANYFVDFTDKFDSASLVYLESWYGKVEPEITTKHPDYLETVNHLASFYEETDDYKLASKLLDDALRAAQDKYDNKDIAYALELEKIANLRIKIGQYEESEKLLNECIQILQDTKIAADIADSYMVGALLTQAKLLAIKGEYDEADDNLWSSEKLQSKSILTLETAGLDHADDKASLYLSVGQFGRAQELLLESIALKEDRFGKDSRQLIAPLILEGRLNLVKGDYQKAEEDTRRSLTIAMDLFGGESTKIVPAKLMLADIYIAIGDYEKAEQQLRESIAIQKARFGEDHIDVGKSISQLALVKFYEGDPIEETQPVFEQSEKIIGKKLGSNNPTYAEILKNMAIANISAGNYGVATSYLNAAEKVWADRIKPRNNINAASVSVLKGDIAYRQRKYKEAENYYKDGLKRYKRTLSDEHPEYTRVQAKLGRTYYMQGDWKNAQSLMEEVLVNYTAFIEQYFPALSEREKAKYWNTVKPNYEFYNTLVVSKMDNPAYVSQIYNNALLTKGLLLSTSIKVRQRIMGSNDAELIQMYTDWVAKKELLTVALSMNQEQLMLNQINSNQLRDEVELLEKEMSLRSELFANRVDSKTVKWEDVSNSLKENEVAIEMVRFRVFDHEFTDSVVYAVLYLQGGKKEKPEMILLNNGMELEGKFLQNFRNSIKYRLSDEYSYDTFWKPIISRLGTISRMYISPDGVYNQINLEAIPTPDGRYVLDNSNIVLVNNTKDLYLDKFLKRTEAPGKNKMASMFGDPDFYLVTKPGEAVSESGLDRPQVVAKLPGTREELVEVGNLLDRKGMSVDKYMEKEANEQAIKNVDSPRIFHVATHGFFQSEETSIASANDELNAANAYENPLLKTGLLLSGAGDILNETKFNYNVDNGILTAYEALNLNLDRTDLVVLSACETGLGKVEAGEGVYGLQRAFLVAGARTIVMSLFKVSDEATQKLMVKFYRKWLETGQKRESFIEAKKEIRNEYQDPIFWGPFIMIGLE